MSHDDTRARLSAYRSEIADIRKRMRELRAGMQPEPVHDYALSDVRGTVALSSLFGDSPDLIVVHSMGIGCPYCTLWADGYNGIYSHLARRAAFVIVGPDAPEDQQRFAASRGWRFPLASHRGTTFAEDMGYRAPSGALVPGLSVFKREGAQLFRVSDAASKPGDDFCALWHIFELLPDGARGWVPET